MGDLKARDHKINRVNDQISLSIEEEEQQEKIMELRRGPWTLEEDITLINYISVHGEGRWNSLARCAGLKRTGKSCRLRWLNYLRPDVRRGNISLEEQLLILELHSHWGNRWSKIAQHLPGRTDNEIKNYWRTRVQKQAKQLKCDVNSKQFKEAMRYIWMPRLVERIDQAAATTALAAPSGGATSTDHVMVYRNHEKLDHVLVPTVFPANNDHNSVGLFPTYTPENSSTGGASSDSFGTQVVSPASDLTDYYNIPVGPNPSQDNYFQANQIDSGYTDSLTSPIGYNGNQVGSMNFPALEQNRLTNQWFLDGGDTSDNLWNAEDMWFLQ